MSVHQNHHLSTTAAIENDDCDDFWDCCLNSTNRLSATDGHTTTATSDAIIGSMAQDAAGNTTECANNANFMQCFCEQTPPSNANPHCVEFCTPGMQQPRHHHANEGNCDSQNIDFGRSVTTGDFDGDGSTDDLAIGAPACSHSHMDGPTDDANGTVFAWCNGFRERATRKFITKDTTTDVSGKHMQFAVDGNMTHSVCLDPSTDAGRGLSHDSC